MCQCHAHAHLSLHIRGEAGIGARFGGSRAETAVTDDSHGIIKGNNLHAHVLQLAGDAIQMLGNDILHQHIAAGGSHSCQISTCLNLVGDDGVGAAPQRIDSADFHRVCARTGNPGTHGVKKVGKVYDVRLLGGVFNDGLAGQQGCCQHDVYRRTHGGKVQTQAAALQAIAA